jgi:membrane protease YdiL (CAAX protease family)
MVSFEKSGRSFILVYGAEMGSEPIGRRIVWIGVAFEGGLALLALLLGWILGQPPLQKIHWSNQDAIWGLAACVPMLAVFIICVRWPVGPLVRIKQFSEEFIREWFAECSLLDLAVISLLAGIGEEMLFRGVIQESLTEWLNPLTGIVLASLLFGLMHPITPFYIVMAAGMGAFLGWIFILTENLLPIIITHGLYDFLALAYLTRTLLR